uniref:Uncharacterized protein LOC102802513 n=1 Tax=Saccoglossus kowalevskii TaxID=10224 RepID=A0ABM0MGI1_SACKO|nr:PREDICTED: uncharacterized protein LOC102802513 [Saccoglossus kowalevskii]
MAADNPSNVLLKATEVLQKAAGSVVKLLEDEERSSRKFDEKSNSISSHLTKSSFNREPNCVGHAGHAAQEFVVDLFPSLVKQREQRAKGRGKRGQINGKRKPTGLSPFMNFAHVNTWTHRFCLLSGVENESTPTIKEKQLLLEAAWDGGGFTLWRCGGRNSKDLVQIYLPNEGYTVKYLKEESVLGSAVCYIKPLQRDLPFDTCKDKTSEVKQSSGVKIKCIYCAQTVAMNSIQDHHKICNLDILSDTDDDDDDDDLCVVNTVWLLLQKCVK